MLKRVMPFMAVYLMLLSLVGYLLLSFPKGELHIMLNSFHTPWQDTFFRYYTKLAEWPFYVIAVIPLLFREYRWWTYVYVVSEVGNALVTTIVKQVFNMPRPASYFGDRIGDMVPLVDGVHLHNWHSFPSGHTATFFIFFTTLFLLYVYYRRREAITVTRLVVACGGISLLLIGLAALGSYSRIYLSQHFLMDCFVGSMIGVTMPMVVFNSYLRIKRKRLLRKEREKQQE